MKELKDKREQFINDNAMLYRKEMKESRLQASIEAMQ